MSKKKHQNEPRRRICVLCGRSIPVYRNDCIVGATGRVVCSACLKTSERRILARPAAKTNESPKSTTTVTPQEIIAGMDRSIIGQRDAKEAVALALWKQKLMADGNLSVPKCNLLLCGPTGCGKTSLIEAAAKLVDISVRVADMTTVTQCGWRGKDPEEIIKEYAEANRNHPNLPFGVICLDECDKLAAPQEDEQHAAANRGAQHGLLKLVEGAEIDCGSVTLNTANLMFVFCGAFAFMRRAQEVPRSPAFRPIGFVSSPCAEIAHDDMPAFEISDFIANGMEPELMGRVGQIVELRPLSERDLVRIIRESDRSIFAKYKRFFAGFGIDLVLTDAAAKSIAHYALQRGTGARGLNARVEELVHPLMLRLNEGKLSGTVNILEGERYYAAH